MRDISLVKILPIEPRVPFISGRKIAAILSFLAVIASIFLFSTKNLNYGIDFTGGTVIEVDTGSKPDLEQIRTPLNDLGLGEVALQTIDPPRDGAAKNEFVRVTVGIQDETPEKEVDLEKKVIQAIANLEGDNFIIASEQTSENGFTSFRITHGDEPIADIIRSEVEEEDAGEGTTNALTNSTSNDAKLDEIENVIRSYGLNTATVSRRGPNDVEIRFAIKEEASANVQQLALAYTKLALANEVGGYTIRSQGVLGSKVSGELRQKGIMAIVLALSMVLLYIWFRFEWQFAVGAVVALFHDVLLTIGVFSLTQLEFNLSIIAAILTIVGYSLNDTVIVYDRIRENMRKYKKMAMPELINLSINDTLSRTIMTSMTTLLALFALYILGGDGLRGFSFAMIWGVFVGTYSSIFVASPILLSFKLRNIAAQSEAA
ncbi:MAG: protein translocase subunit SecF [Hellea sp.]|nr:protein translocase subunit SecF [Hellea sp.]